jgi:hypothetical protein
MTELHHPPNGISSRCQDSALNPTAPDDVLGRLKNIIENPDLASRGNAIVRLQLLRDAVAEIERLRAEIARENSAYVRAFEADQAPKPERWETGSCRMATSGWEVVGDGGEPFAVTDSNRVWFRRRVPT